MSHSSLNRWLIRTVVLSTGGALGLACLVLLGHEVTSLRASIEQEATTLAQVVGVNCAVPLSFDDGEAVRETLASVSAAGHIMEAVVYDHEGKIFAQFLPDGQEPLAPPSARPDGTRVTDGALQVIRPILFDGTRIGTILLRRDRAELTRLTSRFVLLIGGLLALVGVLVVWVASRLRRHISRPLADLARGSAIIAAGDLTAPSPEFRDDEIGLLARDFDDMRRGLRDLVGQVRHGISDVSLVAQAMEVSGGLLDEEVTRQRQAIGETTDSLQQVGTSIGEMNANIEQMARSARSTSVSILEIDDSFGSVVERMNTQSGSIETTLEAVGGLVGSIGEIGTAVGAL
ncbi:MAG: CHASE sensor domain-containing protein, partial [Acidobacteriota bacterium]